MLRNRKRIRLGLAGKIFRIGLAASMIGSTAYAGKKQSAKNAQVQRVSNQNANLKAKPKTKIQIKKPRPQKTIQTNLVNSQTSLRLGSNPIISAQVIDAELMRAGSPLAGKGQLFVDLGRKYNILPEFALALFNMESNYGTRGFGARNMSVSNMRYTPPPKNSGIFYENNGGFRKYASWEDGLNDFFRLLHERYFSRGLDTLGRLVPVYSPAQENNPSRYISIVSKKMSALRNARNN